MLCRSCLKQRDKNSMYTIILPGNIGHAVYKKKSSDKDIIRQEMTGMVRLWHKVGRELNRAINANPKSSKVRITLTDYDADVLEDEMQNVQ